MASAGSRRTSREAHSSAVFSDHEIAACDGCAAGEARAVLLGLTQPAAPERRQLRAAGRERRRAALLALFDMTVGRAPPTSGIDWAQVAWNATDAAIAERLRAAGHAITKRGVRHARHRLGVLNWRERRRYAP